MDLDQNVNVVNGDRAVLDGVHLNGILEVGNGGEHDHFLKSESPLGAFDLSPGESFLVGFDGLNKAVWFVC